MIQIYAVRVPDEISINHFKQLLKIVSVQKAEQISRILHKGDKYRTLLGDALIRKIVSNKFDIKPADIIIHFNSYGKPQVANYPFYFNVSHSGSWVVCAIHNDIVGIDIEQIKPLDLDIAAKFFSWEENEDLNLNKEPIQKLNYFYDLWTLKESYVKALGAGLSIPLNSFTIKKDTHKIYVKHHNNVQEKDLYFMQYSIADDYKLSVCAKNGKFSFNANDIQYFSILELI